MRGGDGMLDKCIGCVWADVTLADDDGVPFQVFCLPHPGGCKTEVSDVDNQDDQAQDRG